MLRTLKKIVGAAVLASISAFAVLPTAAQAQAQGQAVQKTGAACSGKIFNPLSDTDWNNLYPISIVGFRVVKNVGPVTHWEAPVCTCPGPFGIPSIGVGITYWEPLYIAEIERTPGCLESLGGVSVLSGYSTLQSEQVNEGDDGGPVSRMQVHWYQYPVMSVIKFFESIGCKDMSGFDLAYITEIDPTWQSDEWAAVFAPEASLFTSVLAQSSCALDAIAASGGLTIDAMFWCAGSWGSIYPLSGNAAHTNSNFTSNNLVQAKFLARQARLGLQMQTIGPSATCFSHPNPIWVKSQYRVNQVSPIPRKGNPVVVGSTGLLQFPTIANMPSKEHTTNLIWQAKQCCLRLY